MNYLLMDNITDAGMQKSLSSRGGRTVYQQLVHVHNVRMQWLEICAKDIFKTYKVLDKEAPFDRKSLKKSLDESAKGIEELLSRSWDDGGKVKGFKKGVLPMLGYFISHESHHQGKYTADLKTKWGKNSRHSKMGFVGMGKIKNISYDP
jgi:uncharacterized damage-inducible protein DinB